MNKRLAPLWLPFGLRPSTDGVTITDDGKFVAKFSFLKLETPVSNIDGAHITRDYRWWKAAGVHVSATPRRAPARRSGYGAVSGLPSPPVCW